MHWYQEDDEEEEEQDLMFSPALLARRASESWIETTPVEVCSRDGESTEEQKSLSCDQVYLMEVTKRSNLEFSLTFGVRGRIEEKEENNFVSFADFHFESFHLIFSELFLTNKIFLSSLSRRFVGRSCQYVVSSTQKITAGCAANARVQRYESRGGVGARLGAPRGAQTSKGRVGEVPSQPTALSGQSTS